MKTYVRNREGSYHSWRVARGDEALDAPISDTMVAEDGQDLATKLESMNIAPYGFTYVHGIPDYDNNLSVYTFDEPVRVIRNQKEMLALSAEMDALGKRSSQRVVILQDRLGWTNAKDCNNIRIHRECQVFWNVINDPNRKKKAKKRRENAKKKRIYPYQKDVATLLMAMRDTITKEAGQCLGVNLSGCGNGYPITSSVYAVGRILTFLDKFKIDIIDPESYAFDEGVDSLDQHILETLVPYIRSMRTEMNGHCANCEQGSRVRTCEYEDEGRQCRYKRYSYFVDWLVKKKHNARKAAHKTKKHP